MEELLNGNDLKPCPFCGSTNIYYEKYEHSAGMRWRIVCAECMAGIDPGTAQQRMTLKDAWNKRVSY